MPVKIRNKKKIIFACERTAGHIFPALALSESLMSCRTAFFVPSREYKAYLLNKGIKKIYGIALPFRFLLLELFFRFWEAIYIIVHFNPKIIVGFGSRDIIPLIILAKLFNKKVIIYELNSVLGKTNYFLQYFADRLIWGYPPYKKEGFPKSNQLIVGVPIRQSLVKLEKTKAKLLLGINSNKPVLLIYGGSQGANFINQIVKENINFIVKYYYIIHITGRKDYNEFCHFYDTIKLKEVIFYPFYEDMQLVYSASDVAIARGGASSSAELIFYNIPAIFIPFPGAQGHQKKNVNYLVNKGIGLLLMQDKYKPHILQSMLKMINPGNKLFFMMKERMVNCKLPVLPKQIIAKIV